VGGVIAHGVFLRGRGPNFLFVGQCGKGVLKVKFATRAKTTANGVVYGFGTAVVSASA
jgi:hypothetical protein